ncbi:MAG TPA: hypothetical protein VGS58_07695, partial [Candidatus Sulfopaludibacter sp.]|nr:hypothetical protein [Candidatus Sulfopaludibacter sp.]
CDDDGTALMQREDDRESVIVERFRAYEQLTGPILSWYGDSAICRVDGAAPPDQVKAAVAQAVTQQLAAQTADC